VASLAARNPSSPRTGTSGADGAAPAAGRRSDATAERDRQIDELLAWGASDDARFAARALAVRYRLPVADTIDVLCRDTEARVWMRLHRGGALAPTDDGRDSVVPYARRVMSNAAIDLLRGRPLSHISLDGPSRPDGSDEPERSGNDLPDAAIHDAFTVIEVREAVAEIRGALHRSLGGVERRRAASLVWPSSAAMALLTLIDAGGAVQPPAGFPRPEPGSGADPDRWAALAYAGQQRCFASPDGEETGATRGRRARALATVDKTLRDAARAAGLNGSFT